MPGHAQTDWFDLARALTDTRLGGDDPVEAATRLSPDMGLDDSPASVTAPDTGVPSSPPSIDWACVAIWLGGLVFCVAVLVLVGLAALLVFS